MLEVGSEGIPKLVEAPTFRSNMHITKQELLSEGAPSCPPQSPQDLELGTRQCRFGAGEIG